MIDHTGSMPVRTTGEVVAVSSGLNLWLELNDPSQMGELLLHLLDQQDAINAALNGLHYVHFARFVPTPDFKALQVITSFDGELDAYVLDFALAIGDQFELILSYMKDRPPSRVKDFPAQFLQYVNDHNLGYGQMGGGGIGLFSAYPQRTVIDIVGASGIAATAHEPHAVAVDRSDVQTNVLRGIASRYAVHIGLGFGSAAGARALLSELLSGSHGAPRISSDATWPDDIGRPAYGLTLGLSYAGLVKLGISLNDQAAFTTSHRAFFRGPDKRDVAIKAGDTGSSQPAHWQLGGAYPTDMVVSIYSDDQGELTRQSDALSARCRANGLSVINRPWPAEALTDGPNPGQHHVHFGYVDSLSQPRLAIAGEPAGPQDLQPSAGVGEFLLGADYPNVFGGRSSLGGLSAELAQNATFAALRIMEQDVAAFEALLDSASEAHAVDREWLAAKLMGRWRDGTPLAQSPDWPLPEGSAPPRNAFDYLPSIEQPWVADDSDGLRCPVGAHARRMNPRSARVAGRPHSRRLLRRGMPYGPQYVPGQPDSGQARGLVGLFLCADLDRQFEFILRQWAQGDRATSGLVAQQDPIIGAQASVEEDHPISGLYRIARPVAEGDLLLALPRLVKTIGSVYLFMPGLAGIRYLAGLGSAQEQLEVHHLPPFPVQLHTWMAHTHQMEAEAATPVPDPRSFDPRDKDFRDDPFTTYTWFRDQHPVVFLPKMKSTWVFSHRHVAMVAGDQTRFRKRKSDNSSPAGLLNMDPPAHKLCRDAIEPLFAATLAEIAPTIAGTVLQRYTENCKGKGQVDWLAEFARPISQGVFFDLFGLTVKQASGFIKQVEEILALATPADDKPTQDEIAKKLQQLAITLFLRLKGVRKPNRLFDRIMGIVTLFDPVSNKPYPPPPATPVATALDVEHLANAATLAMAGFLPLQWFIALATWRLLDNGGMLLQQLKNEPAIANRDVVDELLRFDMSAPLSDRFAIQDGTNLDGTLLAKDQRVTIAWSSANRDEAEFGPAADTISLTRGKGPGWAFGDAGQHSCLGRDMVYCVMEPVIQVLREATPTPQLAPGFVPSWGTWTDGAMFRPMTALLVRA